ncbi:hypothetical protein ACLB2K_041550 [Fragaria x ananassa]
MVHDVLRPSPAMMEHLRPLYIAADIDGVKVSKILVDAGAIVSVMTLWTMTMLGIKKSSVIEIAMTIKNFAGGVKKALGILIVTLKTTGRTELVKTDPKPFSMTTNEIGVDYYSIDLHPLTVVGIDQSGKLIRVTSTELA